MLIEHSATVDQYRINFQGRAKFSNQGRQGMPPNFLPEPEKDRFQGFFGSLLRGETAPLEIVMSERVLGVSQIRLGLFEPVSKSVSP